MLKGIKRLPRNATWHRSKEDQVIENMSIDSLEVQDEKARVLAKLGGELEDIVLNPNTLDEITRVGSDLLG